MPAFHLELGAVVETPASNPGLCMELQCTCSREQLVGDMLCFFHHPENELRKKQEPSLLLPESSSSGSYLKVEETTRWFQISLKATWELLPQSCHCCLMVLPSYCSCRLRLNSASKSSTSK